MGVVLSQVFLEEKMAANRPSGVGPLLQAMFAQDGGSQTDGQLLEQFLSQRSQAAFATLVRRHGGMVLGVCRRILGNAADAEDAFQATFVVLLRRARSLTSRPVVGDWLHGVARRTALKAKTDAGRRRSKERAAARSEAISLELSNDWLPLLDQELSRLSEKHRLPIVLCDLEGKTIREAAQRLGWPEGTVAGRLARGRALLASRLRRFGDFSGGTLPGMLIGGLTKAALPLELFQLTLQAAASLAAGNKTAQGVLSAEAIFLAKGVIRTMFWKKTISVAVVLLAGVALATVSGRAVQMLSAQGPQTPAVAILSDFASAKKQLAESNQDKKEPTIEDYLMQIAKEVEALEKLALTDRDKAMEKAARDQWEASLKEQVAGKSVANFLPIYSINFLKAQLRLSNKKSDIIVSHQSHLERMKAVESLQKEKYIAGSIPITQYSFVVYYRIEAENWLEEARRAK
jgi:RNA polymerase sigma factor (sigma-70 family)